MNKAQPIVTVELDKERRMRFDLNAIVRFEEQTGVNVFGGEFDTSRLSGKQLRAMLWACLVGDDQGLTIEHVGEIITADNMAYAAGKLNELFEVSSPDNGSSDRPLPETNPNGE